LDSSLLSCQKNLEASFTTSLNEFELVHECND
jgi:hypothetical protein